MLRNNAVSGDTALAEEDAVSRVDEMIDCLGINPAADILPADGISYCGVYKAEGGYTCYCIVDCRMLVA